MIEAPAIGGAIGIIEKAAPTSVRSKAGGGESFRAALSSEVFVGMNVVVSGEAHAVVSGKQHKKSAGQRAAVTKCAKESESAQSALQSTLNVSTSAALVTQNASQVKPTSILEDAAPKQTTKLLEQVSGPSTGNSKVPALEQGLAAPTDTNAKPVSVDVIPGLNLVGCKPKPSDESATTQPSVSSAVARIASAATPVGGAIISGVEAEVLHKEIKADHIAVATPSSNAPPHAQEVKTLTSTPNVLEIGIASGTHGWLRVRAELGRTGEVSASLVTASLHSAEALHNELPAMAAYLSTEQIGISSVVVNPTEPGVGAHLPQSGSGTHGQADKQRQENSHADEITLTDVVSFNRPAGRGGFLVIPATGYAAGGGGWLSVRV